MATFEQKLSFIMESHKITNTALGEYLYVSRSTISKWKSGDRFFDKKLYAPKIADYFIKNIDEQWLLSLLGLTASHNYPDEQALNTHIVDYLFDGKDIVAIPPAEGTVIIGRNVRNEGCFLGTQGVFDALSLFSDYLKPSAKPIYVYLSSEYCGLLLDAEADYLWDYLYSVNGNRSVKVVFEQWQETGRAIKILQRLLPFIQAKKLELYYIPSTERFFCYNISILAEDSCMVMTTEPAGFSGTSVSVYVDCPEFVVPMSKSLKKLTHLARPMARQIEIPRLETAQINSFFEGEGDINALFDCVNMLYATVDGFKRLLKYCGVPYEKARYHIQRFAGQKEAFEHFLLESGNRDIISIDTIDDFIEAASIKIPELSFPAQGRVGINLSFLKEVLEGMLDYLERYRNIQIALCRGIGLRDSAWRLKEDKFMLLHCFGAEDKACIYSENRLLVGHYINLLETAYQGKSTIRGKANVISAIQKRIDKIGRLSK